MKISVRTSKRLEEAETILIRGTNWIGDAIMTLPAIAAIRKTFPHARISILVKPWVADIFSFCSDVDDVILFLPHKGQYNLANVARVAKEIRGKDFNTAILLQNAIEAAIIAFLGRIPIRAGYNSDARG
ncbi:MAG: glycosyltransferase family 9 protein, partial [Syntrophobacterales bacterium]|nr:glycosyltransferase family 9 protein [Syntrophobacterales bacterium]